MKRALQIVLGIALFGLAFSGWMTWNEVFAAAPVAMCPSPGAPGTVLGQPACVYGFFMYAAIVAVSSVGLLARRRAPATGTATAAHA